jgi:hypothetical protein
MFNTTQEDHLGRVKGDIKKTLFDESFTVQQKWNVIESIINSTFYIQGLASKVDDQKKRFNKQKKRAGCLYSCCCACPNFCFTNPVTVWLFRFLFFLWLFALISSFGFNLYRRIFYE